MCLFAKDCREGYQMCSLKKKYVITYHAFSHILHRHAFSLCEGLIHPKQIPRRSPVNRPETCLEIITKNP